MSNFVAFEMCLSFTEILVCGEIISQAIVFNKNVMHFEVKEVEGGILHQHLRPNF